MMKKLKTSELIALVKYQLSIYTKTKNIIKKTGFILLLLFPLLAKAQTEGQVQIWHNGAWVYQDAGLQYTVLDTVNVTTNLSTKAYPVTKDGFYRVGGWVNSFQLSGTIVVTAYYTDRKGRTQRQGLGTVYLVGGWGFPEYKIKAVAGGNIFFGVVCTGTALYDAGLTVHN